MAQSNPLAQKINNIWGNHPNDDDCHELAAKLAKFLRVYREDSRERPGY